jgi:2-aminobenzoate-CoA ligase
MSADTSDPQAAWTGHVDTFVRDNLPPAEAQPVFLFDLPELQYPEALNAGAALIDEAVARGWGERTAIVGDQGDWSYRRLLETSNRLAATLVEDFGLIPGGRVLLRGANSAVLCACWLAILKAGGVAVTTMPMLRATELATITEMARVDLALTDAALAGELETVAVERPALRVVTFDAIAGMAAEKAADFETLRTHRDDPCLLAFTSGTTGRPKACIHFHRDVLAMADTFSRHILKPSADDVFVATPPMAFTFGLGGGLVFPLRVGAATSFLTGGGVAGLLEHIARHRVTVLFTAPTSYRQMLAQPQADLSSLRLCVSAGEALDKQTSDRWFERTGIRLIDGIGATEMIHIFISAAGDDIRPGATGRPVPGFVATLLDEAGRELPPGEAGRLAVRGPTGCRYLNDPRQANYVQDGWNITGDTFRRDEDGYFWFVSRTDDMIISSGYNIAGPEVEAAVLAHPAVAECVVVAHPDAERGHVPKAFIVLRTPGEAPAGLAREIQDFVKTRIAPYKYPRAIAFVAELPRTSTGKLMRFKLRDEG